MIQIVLFSAPGYKKTSTIFLKILKMTALLFLIINLPVNSLHAGSKGDIDNNGSINILDVTRTLNIILFKPPAPTEYELWAADFNSDGATNILDVTNIINVIIGKRNAPPLITNITPANGPAGTIVTIYGENFGETQGNNYIQFNDVDAVVTEWSNSAITTNVPVGTTSGPVIVTVDGIVSNSINFQVNASSVSEQVTAEQGGTVELEGKAKLIIPPDKFTEDVLVIMEETAPESVKIPSQLTIMGFPIKLSILPVTSIKSSGVRNSYSQSGNDEPILLRYPYPVEETDNPYIDIGMNETKTFETGEDYILYLWADNDKNNHELVATIPEWSYDKLENTVITGLNWENQYCSEEAELTPDAGDTNPLNGRIPIILIHGWQIGQKTCEEFRDFTVTGFTPLINHLYNNGIKDQYKIYFFKYPTYYSPALNSIGLKLKIDEVFSGSDYTDKIVIIGHSMGGLVGRSYIVNDQGHQKVIKLITLGTPHLGSPLAGPGSLLSNTDGTRSLHPDSDFLQQLNQNDIYLDRYQMFAGDLYGYPCPSSKLALTCILLQETYHYHHDAVVTKTSATLNNHSNSIVKEGFDHFTILDDESESGTPTEIHQEILSTLESLVQQQTITTSGMLTHDETWSPDDSPIILTGDIVVPENITLTILPGTEVRFSTTSDYARPEPGDPLPNLISLNVFGSLVAEGEGNNEIIFTSNAAHPEMKDWHDIVLLGSASGSIKHCQIKYGIIGITAEEFSTLTVSHTSTESCRIGFNINSTGNIALSENVIRNDSTGVQILKTSDAVIEDNVIEKNVWGVTIFYESAPEIRNNMITLNEVNGIEISNNSTPVINRNKIINNDKNGIIFSSSHTANAQIYENDIYNNNYYNIVNLSPNNKIAENNWWGMTSESQIKSKIWDQDDQSNLGIIDFIPYLRQSIDGGGGEDVVVRQFVSCGNVVDGEPIDIRENFTTNDDKIWVYCEIDVYGNPNEIKMAIYKPNGNHLNDATFRSVSYGRNSRYFYISPAQNYGSWKVKLNVDGKTIDTLYFSYVQNLSNLQNEYPEKQFNNLEQGIIFQSSNVDNSVTP